jgi:hypothetical protein
MFEEPALGSSAGAEKQQGAPAVIETPAASPTRQPEGPHLEALEKDMQAARDAADDKKLTSLAKLKINYLLGKPPAIKKVQAN